MPEILLKPEIQTFPLWMDKDGVKDNTDPKTLPLSAGLIEDLDEWRSRWDATYDLDDPLNSGFSSPEEERAFQVDGEHLVARLRAELGNGWTVSFRVPG
jgi:hypothetical protein